MNRIRIDGKEAVLVEVARQMLGFSDPRRVYQLIDAGILAKHNLSIRKTYVFLDSIKRYQAAQNNRP